MARRCVKHAQQGVNQHAGTTEYVTGGVEHSDKPAGVHIGTCGSFVGCAHFKRMSEDFMKTLLQLALKHVGCC